MLEKVLFENVGKKIKSAAKFLAYLTLIAGALMVLVGIFSWDDIDATGTLLVLGGIIGTPVSLFSVMLAYGFGELVEKATTKNAVLNGSAPPIVTSTTPVPQKPAFQSAPVHTASSASEGWHCSCGKYWSHFVMQCPTCGDNRPSKTE